MPTHKKVKSREDFFQLVDYILEKNHEEYSNFGKWNSPHMKTYLIESNVSSPLEIKSSKAKDFKFETIEEDFFSLSTPDQTNGGFLDTSKERIWKFFSLLKSSDADSIMNKWVDKSQNLDRCWFSNEFLEKIEKSYFFRGIGVQYENYFQNPSLTDDEKSKASFKLWSKGIVTEQEKKLYEVANNYFSRSSVRVQKTEDGFSKFLNEIYFDGKVTTTFAKTPNDIINRFPNKIVNKYLDLLEKVEEQRGPFGSPVELIFEKEIPIEDIVSFFQKGKKPFRLWLTPIEKEKDFVRLFGVDLHTGQDIGLDLGTDHIWINIPKNTCGNAAFRIPTLLGFAFPFRIKTYLEGEKLIA